MKLQRKYTPGTLITPQTRNLAFEEAPIKQNILETRQEKTAQRLTAIMALLLKEKYKE